jgi:hypothetical protein
MSQASMSCLNRCLFIYLFTCVTVANICADEHDKLDVNVQISKSSGTVYELFKDISAQSGFFFIYDSQIIDNDKKVKIKKGKYSLREAIYLIAGNKNLKIDLSGEYILLRLPIKKAPEIIKEDSALKKETHITFGGRLFDRETGEVVSFASVGIVNSSIGTITNLDGGFQLIIPDTLQNLKVRLSHIGYKSRNIDVSLLENEFVDIEMIPQVISLNEVVVKAVNPISAINEMLLNRELNYDNEPVQLTTFYREGIDHNNLNTDLTESILQVYKTGYEKKFSNDQVKLIKKRRVINRARTDTIFPKMRSGINSCLVLDIIKELPEFIIPDKSTQYKYSYIGKSNIDNRIVNIISFKQKEDIMEPLYMGELYIEEGNKALVEVRFEMNPKFVNQATNMYVDKKAARLKINLRQAKYIVSYKLSDNGSYYINHVRGDIQFRIRQKKSLSGSSLNFWFEMVTCDIQKNDIKAFPRSERLSTKHIFAETKHEYDKDFWENFNIILPEEKLKDDIIRSLNDAIIMK